MAYRGGSQIDFTIDSSFQPFSMQEMLVPFTAYKDAFEKTEEAYLELSDKSDKFKYLSEQLPEGSKARQIYEGYANTLASQAEDLARNGLSMGNRRALTSLKRRYSGEIGRLDKAQTALEKEKELRRAMGLKDPSMLYAENNFTIDNFLDGETPNLYGISGNELYARGAAAGKAASSRVFSAGDGGKTLGGYYRAYIQRMGYNADTIAKFRADASTIPELQQTADAILQERGVLQNLKGDELNRARQSVINGMIDGAVYSESHNLQRDLGVMSASELDASRRGWAQIGLAREELALKKAAAAAAEAESAGSFGFDRRNVSSPADIAKQQADKKMWDKYNQYFTQDKDGNWVMTEEGKKKYKETPYVYNGPYSTAMNHPETDFKKFVDDHGLSGMATGRRNSAHNSAMESLIMSVNNIYDKNVATEYFGQFGASQHDDVLSTLNRVSRDGKVQSYRRVKEGNGYTFKPSEKIDISGYSASDITSAVHVTSKYGNYLEVTTKKGERIIVPYGMISSNYDQMIQGNLNVAEELRKAKSEGKTMVPINGRMVDIDVAINMAISHSMGNFASGMGTTIIEPLKRSQGFQIE